MHHDASGYNFYFRRCFLHVEKSAWQHDLVLALVKDAEYVTKYHIIEIASRRIVTDRNAPHEKRIRVGQP